MLRTPRWGTLLGHGKAQAIDRQTSPACPLLILLRDRAIRVLLAGEAISHRAARRGNSEEVPLALTRNSAWFVGPVLRQCRTVCCDGSGGTIVTIAETVSTRSAAVLAMTVIVGSLGTVAAECSPFSKMVLRRTGSSLAGEA